MLCGGGGVGAGRVRGVRVDVNEELMFFGKFTQKKSGWGGREGGSGWGVRVDVNEELNFLRKIQKTNWGGCRGLGRGLG